MKVGVPKETYPDERRVALVPVDLPQLIEFWRCENIHLLNVIKYSSRTTGKTAEEPVN